MHFHENIKHEGGYDENGVGRQKLESVYKCDVCDHKTISVHWLNWVPKNQVTHSWTYESGSHYEVKIDS